MLRRYADARGRLVLVVGLGQRQHQRQAGAIREQRLHVESVVGPLALQAGDQRALERGMRFRLEQIHQRHARQRIVAGVAEQLEPGAVGIDDDALLHVSDRVGRAVQKVLQLFAIFARRGQRGGEGALQPVRPQLARGHRLQAAAVGQRDHILSAQAHRLGDRGLVDVLAHDQHRHLRSGLLPDLHDRTPDRSRVHR